MMTAVTAIQYQKIIVQEVDIITVLVLVSMQTVSLSMAVCCLDKLAMLQTLKRVASTRLILSLPRGQFHKAT